MVLGDVLLEMSVCNQLALADEVIVNEMPHILMVVTILGCIPFFNKYFDPQKRLSKIMVFPGLIDVIRDIVCICSTDVCSLLLPLVRALLADRDVRWLLVVAGCSNEEDQHSLLVSSSWTWPWYKDLGVRVYLDIVEYKIEDHRVFVERRWCWC